MVDNYVHKFLLIVMTPSWTTGQDWIWISHYMPLFYMDVITYPRHEPHAGLAKLY